MRAGTLLLLLLAGIPAAYSQPKTTEPAFEVASIKPSPLATQGPVFTGLRGGPGSADPLAATFSRYRLFSLINFAYDLKIYQLNRDDSRLQQDDFDVNVRIPEGATRAQFQAMMRTLLAERFHLRIHWEKKTIDVYDLVQAKGGHKLKPPTAPGERKPLGALEKDEENLPKIPPGVSMQICAFAGCRVQQIGENLDMLIRIVSSDLNAPVNDATGLTGKFDYTIGYGSSGPNRPLDAPPPLATAITEQLGLRVEKRKGEGDVLIVDSVDRQPTEN